MTMKRTYFPQTRLSKLIARPGAVTRDEALAKARDGIEEMRDESVAEIELAISAIETAVALADARGLAPEIMAAILRQGDRIVTLAGTFGYDMIDAVVRSLCDVTGGLIQAGSRDAAPIAVHARALRLVAPNAKPLADDDATHMLCELARVAEHYQFASFETAAAQLADQPAAAGAG